MERYVPIFEKFVLLLNEDKPGSENPLTVRNSVAANLVMEGSSEESLLLTLTPRGTPTIADNEPLITRLGKLLMGKIRAHSGGIEPALFTPDEILKKNPSSLAPVMYRIAAEDFAKSSTSPFKIIECRNETKLASDWKPSLPDILISLGHQVILVELKNSFGLYNDFVYGVLRQMNYDWRIRLPRSFFFPDDVCETVATADEKLILITPAMPDGELKISDKIKDSLQYDILMMLKASCESAMENHLLMRDLRVGKFADACDGVNAIRNVYRSLIEKFRTGEDISFGEFSSQQEQLREAYIDTGIGDSILSAENMIIKCQNFGLTAESDEDENENTGNKVETCPDLCSLPKETSQAPSNYKRMDQGDYLINSEEHVCDSGEIENSENV